MLKLVIGNKNYSSWSMRPWILLTQAGIPFEEVQVWLGEPDTAAQIARHSPTGVVPVLMDTVNGAELRIWDSLAICEYVAEKFPGKALWPADVAARAQARAVSAEMHSGFSALRSNMPMNIRNRYPGKGMAEGVAADIARVSAIWRDCTERYGGPFLFGNFSVDTFSKLCTALAALVAVAYSLWKWRKEAVRLSRDGEDERGGRRS